MTAPEAPLTNPFLVVKSAEYEASAVQPTQYPHARLPEIAFAGRSNVGKSSLINCLLQRRNLVKTSRTPGRTRTINFFRVNGCFFFVDLPGYGFAKVPESVRASWQPMVERYLTERAGLRGVVQIMDIRHPPTTDDVKLRQWLQHLKMPSIPVLTKSDKIPRGKHRVQVKAAAMVLGLPEDEIVVFSSDNRSGREELLRRITLLIEGPDQHPACD